MSESRIHVFRSRQADELRRELDGLHASALAANVVVRSIGRELWTRMRDDATASRCLADAPIFVLRGGLLMRDAYRDVLGDRPCGIIVPVRGTHQEIPRIAYGSIPIGASRVLVADVVTASGRTMDVCLAALAHRLGTEVEQFCVVSPFVSRHSRETLLSAYPGLSIYCLWPDEEIDEDGRMVGPGFDVGDYALGGPSGGFDSWTGT